MDGDIDQEGRVEVCINGVWGSVCSNGWDDTDAYVTCKYLGYGQASEHPTFPFLMMVMLYLMFLHVFRTSCVQKL